MIAGILEDLRPLLDLDGYISKRISARQLVETSGKILLSGPHKALLAKRFHAAVAQATSRDVQVSMPKV